MAKIKYEIADNRGNWEQVKKGTVTEKGWLHYEFSDGTIGLKPTGKWRVAGQPEAR